MCELPSNPWWATAALQSSKGCGKKSWTASLPLNEWRHLPEGRKVEAIIPWHCKQKTKLARVTRFGVRQTHLFFFWLTGSAVIRFENVARVRWDPHILCWRASLRQGPGHSMSFCLAWFAWTSGVCHCLWIWFSYYFSPLFCSHNILWWIINMHPFLPPTAFYKEIIIPPFFTSLAKLVICPWISILDTILVQPKAPTSFHSGITVLFQAPNLPGIKFQDQPFTMSVSL